MARPTLYTADLAEAICTRLIEGDSLRKICESDDMPDRTTILRWLIKHPEFCTQYTQARELQSEGDLDEVVEIADDSSCDLGFKVAKDKDGEGAKPVFLHDHVQRAKLRIETRLKRSEKMHPKKYGPLLKQEIGGPDGKPIPMSLTIEWTMPTEDKP